MTDSDLGAVVKSLRSLYGVGQAELAQYLEIPRTALSKIETGDRSITALEIASICEFFDLDPNNFYQRAIDRMKWLESVGGEG